MVISVIIMVYADCLFDFIIKMFFVVVLIFKEIGVFKGFGVSNRCKFK